MEVNGFQAPRDETELERAQDVACLTSVATDGCLGGVVLHAAGDDALGRKEQAERQLAQLLGLEPDLGTLPRVDGLRALDDVDAVPPKSSAALPSWHARAEVLVVDVCADEEWAVGAGLVARHADSSVKFCEPRHVGVDGVADVLQTAAQVDEDRALFVVVHVAGASRAETIRLFEGCAASLRPVAQEHNWPFVLVAGSSAASSERVAASVKSPSSLRPPQSFEVVDSRVVSGERLYAIPAAYHWGKLTRRDTCTQFNERECATRGCNGLIHAHHFLRELAFQVGALSKYGA